MKIREILREDKFVRVWYHGTSPLRYAQILKDGFLRPRLADYWAEGKAIFFTSIRSQALNDYGSVLFCLTAENAKKFKSVRTGEAELLVKQAIPLKYLKTITSNDVKPVIIGGKKYPRILTDMKQIINYVQSVSPSKISRNAITAVFNNKVSAELKLIPIKKLIAGESEHNTNSKNYPQSINFAPLLVTDFGNSFEILDGNYRFKMARKAGVKELWCYVVTEEEE